MIEHNSPNGYKGIVPSAENILFHPSFHATTDQRNGLYYRHDVTIDIQEATQRLLNGTGLIQDYQYWAEQAWKKEHGTYGAVERFGDKLYEEHEELSVELRPLQQGKTVSAERLVSESGDVLWCTSALASCAAADLDAAFKLLLFRYIRGVQHCTPTGEFVQPVWRDTAAALATKYEQLTTADIDALLAAGFEPLYSPVMNIDDADGDEYEPLDHLTNSFALSATLRNETEAQYGWDGDALVLPQAFRQRSHNIGELVAGIFLEIAWIAKRVASTTLGDVLGANVTKVNSRVETQTVDKTDGHRFS